MVHLTMVLGKTVNSTAKEFTPPLRAKAVLECGNEESGHRGQQSLWIRHRCPSRWPWRMRTAYLVTIRHGKIGVRIGVASLVSAVFRDKEISLTP
mmetsp:Transcript_11370/g.31768  ORF Transcript_11370/g.31768 Transcript_11370/m.31768 type:complete len:95 (+) Transcript_11370:732-1016(+)